MKHTGKICVWRVGIGFQTALCLFPAFAQAQNRAVFLEPPKREITVLHADGRAVEVETQNVWKPICAGDPSKVTEEDLKEIARLTNAAAAAAVPVGADVVAGTSPGLNLTFNVIGSLPVGAAEALAEVERFVEAQFDDPITVTISFSFASLPPGVLGGTSTNFVTNTWPTARAGLVAGMDFDDIIQPFLPDGSTIPVRYNGNSDSVTNENRVFVSRAAHNATIGSLFGTTASITFSSNFSWDYTPPSITLGTFDFQSVIIHEVGHALGFTSGADFRSNDIEILDIYRFQLSDGTMDYNPDTLEEFMTTARMVDINAPGTVDDVISDLISVEYRMSDGEPNQASHFRDQNPPIGIMDPTIGSGQTFYPNFYRESDLNMLDAIGYDYPHANTSCPQALDVQCNAIRNFDNFSLNNEASPPFECGNGHDHVGALWYKFVATETSARISTCSSVAPDTTFAVYSGSCGQLVEIACSEDGGCSGAGLSSICVTGLGIGQTYYIQIAAQTPAERGVITLDLGCSCVGACCLPPPTHCTEVQASQCTTIGGSFAGPETLCKGDGNADGFDDLCEVDQSKFSQFPTTNEEDIASNIDGNDMLPDQIILDDFQSDGRAIRSLRWWGSELDPAVAPDGWLISFHEPQTTASSAAVPLGLYFCGSDIIVQKPTPILACDGESVLEYSVALPDCCLIHAAVDSRSGELPATANAFFEELCFEYDLGIQAIVGRRFDPDEGGCLESATGNSATDDFWGWHSGATDHGARAALSGAVSMSGSDWVYGPWSGVVPSCGTPNMAFELLTTEHPEAQQLGWDNGLPNDDQRLNSQFGGQITDWMTVDDFSLPGDAALTKIEWFTEEENAFSWSGRVRLEIYPDTGGMAPDESGGPTVAMWIPTDGGSVSRTFLGPGAFFARYVYEIANIDLHLATGSWWLGMAPEGSTSTGRTFWLTSRTLSIDGFVNGGQAYFRTANAGFPTFTPWANLLVNEQHDMAMQLTTTKFRDCNCNGIEDATDVMAGGGSSDCNGNGIPDECERDCNGNGTPDDCDITGGASLDCQSDGVPDECDVFFGDGFDSDGDLVLDPCDVCDGFDDLMDADGDGTPDGCDQCEGFDDDLDADGDGIPDDCDNCGLPNPEQLDCQPNGIGDVCDLADETSGDCNQNLAPDDCEGIQPVQAPLPEPGGPQKVRCLSFLPGNGGQSTAIRVTLDALHDADTPNPPDFSAFVGQKRWVGPVGECVDSPALGTFMNCAQLQCDPYFTDWNLWTDGDVLHVTGAEFVPSSEYSIQVIAAGCNLASEVGFSNPLVLNTTRWADVNGDLALNVSDVSNEVDVVKGVTTGHLPKHQAQIQPNAPDPTLTVTVLDVAGVVDSLKGIEYPFPGPCNCPSSVSCNPTTTCTSTADCAAPRKCINFVCSLVDGCSRCTP